LGDMMRLGLESDWPLAVIDLDKRLVCISSAGSQIGKHFEMKWQYQRAKINAILYQQQTEESALCYQYGDNGGDKGDNGSQTGAGAANGMGLLGRTGGQSMKIDKPDNGCSEMRNCACESHVAEFLARLDILPMEQGVRIGFIRQFLLALENKARAFITYVQDAR
uniref:Sen15 domain-containing protein n=1 Tax=Anisakis simplex TaxID=6269 RepID=A0A0M3JC85_ANISI